MELLNFFKLEKLRIEMYGNRRRIGLPKETLKVMFNPESYSLSYKNEYSDNQSINSSGRESKYILSSPESLSLKIIIDGTGTADFGLVNLFKKNVYEQVDDFLKKVARRDGNLHEPQFLKIAWGKNFKFDCRLEEVTVTYTLFDQSGNPLRAELDASFIDDIDTKKRLKLEDSQSADLTHKRIVKEGDTLLLLCEAIYGAPDYYLQVAKANKLGNFRNIVPGQELYFPPLNK